MNFSITHDLISDVEASYSKYEADRIARKALAEAQATQKRKEQEETAKSSLIASEVASIKTIYKGQRPAGAPTKYCS